MVEKVKKETAAAAKKPAVTAKPKSDATKKTPSKAVQKAEAKAKVQVETVKKVGLKKAESIEPAADKAATIADVAPKAAEKTEAPAKPKAVKPAKDSAGRTYATGKRKSSIARVWIMPGKGRIVVNGKDFESYFRRPILQLLVCQPFEIAKREKAYDVMATLKGGGLSGQAGALKHGISRALVLAEPELRAPIKAAGFLTRDSRVVERKHYGHKKARKSFQFSKR